MARDLDVGQHPRGVALSSSPGPASFANGVVTAGEFAEKHADAEGPLDAWYRIVKGREYGSPCEVWTNVKRQPSAAGRRDSWVGRFAYQTS